MTGPLQLRRFSAVLVTTLASFSALPRVDARGEELSARVEIQTGVPRTRLDRATGLLTSRVPSLVGNPSGATFEAPLHLVVGVTAGRADRVHMPDALGGAGSGLYGSYYYDLGPPGTDGTLPSGGYIGRELVFERDKYERFRYDTAPHGEPRDERPPVLVLDPLEYALSPGETLAFGMSASDPDGQMVTLSAEPSPDQSEFNATGGVNAVAGFVFTPDDTQRGAWVVEFTALDETGLTDRKAVRIVVVDENRPPTVSAPAAVEVAEGDLLAIPVSADDPDGDPITLDVGPLPDNAVFIRAAGGITFAPDYDQAGVYSIDCVADDGILQSAPATIEVTVTEVGSGGGTNALVLYVHPVESPTLVERQRVTGTVNAAPGLAAPQRITAAIISGVDPAGARQGATGLEVVLTGRSDAAFATHFTDGLSVANFGAGIVVSNLEVSSPSQAVARISVDADAAPGPRGLRVTTGSETALAVPAFNVMAGLASASGRIVDPATGLGIAGARIVVEGTPISVVTGADGSFALSDLPVGELSLVVMPPDHELVRLTIQAEVGTDLALGDLGTEATVYDPTTAVGLSIHSLMQRGLCEKRPVTRSYDEAEALVHDVLLLCGGSEVGFLDSDGRQVNPSVEGYGLLSLNADAVRMLAQRVELNLESVSLMELLFALSWGPRWQGDEFPALSEWMTTLQEMVNRAWAEPQRPENRMLVLIFNSGRSMTPAPPVLSPETRLNPLQAFLLTSSFLAAAYSPEYTPGWPHAQMDLPEPGGWRAWLETLGALFVTPCYAQAPQTNEVTNLYTRYWRGMFEQKNMFVVGSENGPSRLEGAFTEAMVLTASLPTVIALPGGTAVGASHIARAYGSVGDQLTGIYGSYAQAAKLPQPPGPASMAARVVVDENEKVSVEITFGTSSSQSVTEYRDPSYSEIYIYRLYRFTSSREPRTLVDTLTIDGDTPVYLLGRSMTVKGIDTKDERAAFMKFRWTMRDTDPLPMVRDEFGQLVPAANATWFYAITVSRVTDPYILEFAGLRSVSAPWWTLFLTHEAPPLDAYEARRDIQTGDYSDPILVRLDREGEVVYDTYELELHPTNSMAYVAEPMVAGDTNRPGRIYAVTNLGQGARSPLVDTGFAAPGHRGLAIDSHGYLYSENAASDALFGGRIFSYNAEDGEYLYSGVPPYMVDLYDPRSTVAIGTRYYAGSINYFSRLNMSANPAVAGPLAMGPGVPESIKDSPEALYVLDELAQEVKKVPVQAMLWPPERRVGKRFAVMPFAATGQDMEVPASGSAELLVQGVPSMRLETFIEVPSELAINTEFDLLVTVRNPSSVSITNLQLVLLEHEGKGDVVELSQPDPSTGFLGPYSEMSFRARYQTVASGEVLFRARTTGNVEGAGGSATISSALAESDPLTVGSTIEIVDAFVDESRANVGDLLTVSVVVKDSGGGGVEDLTLTSVVNHQFIEEPFGEAVLESGPVPAVTDLTPGGDQVFDLTWQAAEMGWVSFRQSANGRDVASGTAVSAGRFGPVVLISPLEVSAGLSRRWVPFVPDASIEATVAVTNSGNQAVRNVVATWEFSLPAFSNITGNTGPVDLGPGEGHVFTFTFAEPIKSGSYRADPIVTAETEAGDPIPVDQPSQRFSIGTIVRGRVMDVTMTADPDPKKPMLGNDLLQEGVTPVTNVYVHIVGEAEPDFETYTDAEGYFVLPVPGNGESADIEGVLFSHNLGFQRYDVMVGPEDDKVNEILLPVSLVNTATNLVAGHRLFSYKAGELPVALPDIGKLIEDEVFVATLPEFLWKDVKYVGAMTEVSDAFTSFLRNRIQRGLDTPRYTSVHERDSLTKVNEWDALLRLNALAAFNLRRFNEAAELNATGTGILAGLLASSKAVSDSIENAHDTHVYNEHLDGSGGLLLGRPVKSYEGSFDPDSLVRADNTSLGQVEGLAKALSAGAEWYLEQLKVDKATRDKITGGFGFLEELAKVGGAWQGKDFKGIMGDSVKLFFQAVGMAVLQPTYQSMVEAAMLEAIDRAEWGEMGEGSTLVVLEDLDLFDQLIVGQVSNRISGPLKSSKLVNDAREGMHSALEPVVSNLGFFTNVYTELNFYILATTNGPPDGLLWMANEKSQVGTDLANHLNNFYEVAQGGLKYYRIYLAAAALLEAHFTTSGRLGLGAQQAMEADPLFRDRIYDEDDLNQEIFQAYAELWGL